MEEILTIKPARQSNILKSINANIMFETDTSEGVKITNNLGAIKGLTIPGIQGNKRIIWNHQLRKFHVGDLSKDELNTLVAECKFKNDMPGHPDKGKMITSCDVYDFSDPFFNNRMADIKLAESVGNLSSLRAFEKIFSYYAKSTPMEFVDTDKDEGNLSSLSAKYQIINSNNVVGASQKTRLKSEDATKLLFSLNDDKKLKIALYLGLIPSENIDRQLIDDALWNICVGKENIHEVKRELFIDLCKVSTEVLNTRHLIAKCKTMGFLKKTNGNWNLQGNQIGRTDKEVELYFDDLANGDIIGALENKIQSRKK